MMLFLFFSFSSFTAIYFTGLFYFSDLITGQRAKKRNFKHNFMYLVGAGGLLWHRFIPCFKFFKPKYQTEKSSIIGIAKKNEVNDIEHAISLPYFDALISGIAHSNSSLSKSFGTHVHWGYWMNPKSKAITDDDYFKAACNLTKKVCSHAGIYSMGLNGHDLTTKSQRQILDVGCGFGGTISHLNDELNNTFLTGLNLDPRQLERARKNISASHNNHIQFVEGNACNLPFENDRFDNILAIECIFHFPSREEFFQHAARVLKPGGSITITDFIPHPIFLPSCWLLHFRIFKIFNFFGHCDFNYTLKSYKKLAKKHGFIISVEDISHNTLPTYKYLRKLSTLVFMKRRYRILAPIFSFGMRFITWTRLLSYKIVTFNKIDSVALTRK